MKAVYGLIIALCGIVLLFLYTKENYRSQRLAKGIYGTDFPGSQFDSRLLTGGATIEEKPENAMQEYSLYSTKVNPTTYQPVTNTCFDEYMAVCAENCSTRECLEECQIRATERCSQRAGIPKMISHPG